MTPLAAGLAGLATSFGPCVAPRFVAIVGFAGSGPRRARFEPVVGFASGVAVGYVALVSTMSLLTRLTAWSSAIDVVLAAAFAVAAVHSATSRAAHHCERETVPSVGRAFITGVSLSLVGSPCCAPVLLGLAAVASSTPSPAGVAVCAACFAIGHVVPLVALGAFAARAVRGLTSPAWTHARATVACGLFLGLSAFYTWQA